MSAPINTIPLQQFIQLVKAAELSQSKEIRLDIKTAKTLVYCLSEINSKLVENYDVLLQRLLESTNQSVTIQMDGGGFSR